MNTKLPADMAAVVRTYMLPFACDRDDTLKYLETLIDKKNDAEYIECIAFGIEPNYIDQFLYNDIYTILSEYFTYKNGLTFNGNYISKKTFTNKYLMNYFYIMRSIQSDEKIIHYCVGPIRKYRYDNVYNMWIDKHARVGFKRETEFEILIFTRDIEAWRRRTANKIETT